MKKMIETTSQRRVYRAPEAVAVTKTAEIVQGGGGGMGYDYYYRYFLDADGF